jgi:protein-S-isoprenylcysteine O-methyltransferase Ste14
MERLASRGIHPLQPERGVKMFDKGSLRRGLDLFEQVTVALLYGWLFIRLCPDDFSGLGWFPLLLLVSEGIVVVFLVFRRRTENISIRFRDWLIAFAGTFFALLVVRGGDARFAESGAILIVAGILLHVGAKLSLRRSFGIVAADRGIKAGGLYRYVRHPMYLGYMLSHLGYLLIAPLWWNALVYALSWLFLIARVFAEERILSENPDYRAYMGKVPHRLVQYVF